MPTRVARLLLWLFVMNLGIAFGAGVYEHRIVAPRWLVQQPDGSLSWNANAVQLDDTGRRFWAFVTTGPLTLLSVANLWMAWRQSAGRLRQWWMTGALLSISDRVFTFGYFIPTMVGLMNAPDSSEAATTAARWLNLNYLRHAIVLAAWISSLQAFALIQRLSPRHAR